MNELVHLRVPTALKEALQELAKKDDRSLTAYLRQLLNQHVKTLENREGKKK